MRRCASERSLVPLESELSSGDVEIFTSKAEGANPVAIGLVSWHPRGQNQDQRFSEREEAIDSGKDQIARAMRKKGFPLQRLMTYQALSTIAVDLNQADVSALYASVGEGRIAASTIVQRLIDAAGGVDGADDDAAEAVTPTPGRRESASRDVGVVVKGVDDLWVKLARCCTPVPGDAIMGFVTRASGVSVHRENCVNVPSLRQSPERSGRERAPTPSSVFLVNIQVEALDRSRLLADITRALSDTHVNILSASVTTTRDRIATSRFTFEMADPKHLGYFLKSVRTVEGVYDAYRV